MASEVLDLLQQDGASLFKRARGIARDMDSCFRWPIFFNTTCKMRPVCRHCMWHASAYFDKDWSRRYSKDEITEKAIELERAGIKKTYMPSGWMGYQLPDYFYDYVAALKKATRLELIGFFGAINKESLSNLKSVGVDGFWTGIEVLNEATFKKLRPGDDLNARLETLRNTKEMGLKVWGSFLLGIGETEDDIAKEIELLKDLEAESVMIVPVKPAPYTEMEKCDATNQYEVAKVMAATRIALGKIDIMSFAGMGYIEWGIRAGANAFVTSYPWEMDKIEKMRKTLYASEES